MCRYDGGYDPYGGTNAGYTGAYTGYPTSMTMVPMMMPGGQVGVVSLHGLIPPWTLCNMNYCQ